jgi:hypothetical protein
MKLQNQFLIASSLLVLVIAVFAFSTRNQEPARVFPATINRDCAPWDGSAFTMSIPLQDGSLLNISIYQSPDINRPATFSFPDESRRVGNASYLLPSGEYEQLSGKVSFQRVAEGMPVEGKFNVRSERGEQFKGRFVAAWDNLTVMCG